MFTQLLMGWEMRGVAKSYEVIMAWGQVKSERERISVSSWKVGNFFWLESLLQVLPRSRCCLHFYNITRNKSSTRQARIWKTNISVIMITIPIGFIVVTLRKSQMMEILIQFCLPWNIARNRKTRNSVWLPLTHPQDYLTAFFLLKLIWQGERFCRVNVCRLQRVKNLVVFCFSTAA